MQFINSILSFWIFSAIAVAMVSLEGFSQAPSIYRPHESGGDHAFMTPPIPITYATIYGRVATYTGTPVPGVTLQLTGTEANSFATLIDGQYKFDVALEGDYSITPFQTQAFSASSGITTLDLLHIRSHILATMPITSPYKLIAADVDESNSVSTVDFLLIRALVLQINQTYPNGIIWRFVNSDYVFPNPNFPFLFENDRAYPFIVQNQLHQNFIAIKMGDVNFSWDHNMQKTGAAGEVMFAMDDATAIAGSEVSIPVRVKDFSNITGYQFTLSWDADVLELTGIKNESIKGHFGENRKRQGYLTVSWDSETAQPVSLDNDAVAFELNFSVIGESGSSSPMMINSDLIASESYNKNFDLLDIVARHASVKVEESAAGIHHLESNNNLNVFPNPFGSNANITFSLNGESSATILIFDAEGRIVKTISSDNKEGRHHYSWAGDDDNGNPVGNGIYYVKIQARDASQSIKVMKVK